MSFSAHCIRQVITGQVIVDILIWFAVAIPVFILYIDGTPHHRGFLCDDVSLSLPYKPPTFSTSYLLIVSAIVPLIVIAIIEVVSCLDKKCGYQFYISRALTHLVYMYGIFLVGFIIQQGVVEVVKSKMGVLRPNFFDVCRPKFDVSQCPGYVTNYTCTGSDLMEIRDSRLSFPSGHASLAMYVGIFFSMYIEDRLKISFSKTLKIFLQSGLIFIGVLCGVDRILDNKHHPSDVVAGFVLGIVVAVVVYQKLGKEALSNTAEENNCTTRTSRDLFLCARTSEETEPQTPSPLLPKVQPR